MAPALTVRLFGWQGEEEFKHMVCMFRLLSLFRLFRGWIREVLETDYAVLSA